MWRLGSGTLECWGEATVSLVGVCRVELEGRFGITVMYCSRFQQLVRGPLQRVVSLEQRRR